MKLTLKNLLTPTLLSAGLAFVGSAFLIFPARAQVDPDASLGTQNTGGVITGGTLTSDGSQANLFHSFREFSLSSTDSVTFLATPAIENIITRVTGGERSTIDGALQAGSFVTINGTPQFVPSEANFFLLNPSGIQFGPNAQINLLGSFLATTAEQAIFDNGFAFSATDLNTPSPLTISAPIGLQMGTASAGINVNNAGHSLTRLNPQTGQFNDFAPHVQLGDARGLRVFPGKTLALIGNGIQFDGGLVTANSGNVELGSVAAGSRVSLIPTPLGFLADYSQVENFSAIDLSNRSLANVSGFPTQPFPLSPFQVFSTPQGTLQVVGQDITLQNTSVILGQNGAASTTPGGGIRVQAADTLSLQGSDATGGIRSGIFSETIGPAVSGAIDVQAANIDIDDGAGILGFTFSPADGGEINVTATDQLTVSGFNPLNPGVSTAIGTVSVSSGQSGKVTINAPTTLISAGGSVTSLNIGTGRSGDLFVNVDDITITGINPLTSLPSGLSVPNFGAGQVGNLHIDTQRLTIEEGGVIATSSITDGAAGNINIDASERIDITEPTDANNQSLFSINSAVLKPSAIEQALFGFSNSFLPSGDSGDITINTPNLNLNGRIKITVQNFGTGAAGTAQINADTITLSNHSEIRAETRFGEGGDIDLQVQDSLSLSGASRITAESQGIGNAGNIAITSPLLALEESDITVQNLGMGGMGDAGTAQINAGILTLENSNITVQNQGLGDAGTAQINADILTLQNGSEIRAQTRFGEGGDINLQVQDSLSLSGASQITAESGGVGNGGNIAIASPLLTLENSDITVQNTETGDAGTTQINADTLTLSNGSEIRARTISGEGGDINLQLQDSMILSGASQITAESGGVGNAGNIAIASPLLSLENSDITVQNLGTGDAGTAQLNADTLTLRNGSEIRARTLLGEGGDINLQLQDALILRDESRLNAESGGLGNGGNIAIASPVIIALENSDIVANAVQGRGGNIDITSQSVLGTAFRDELTPQSDITASSEFGLNGTVEINTPTVDPSSGAIVLAVDVVDPDQQVAASCSDNSNNNFIASGRGGLPQAPQVAVSANTPWTDLRPQTAVNQTSAAARQQTAKPPTLITEATNWNHNHDGEIQLLAAANILPSTSAGCLRESSTLVSQTASGT